MAIRAHCFVQCHCCQSVIIQISYAFLDASTSTLTEDKTRSSDKQAKGAVNANCRVEQLHMHLWYSSFRATVAVCALCVHVCSVCGLRCAPP